MGEGIAALAAAGGAAVVQAAGTDAWGGVRTLVARLLGLREFLVGGRRLPDSLTVVVDVVDPVLGADGNSAVLTNASTYLVNAAHAAISRVFGKKYPAIDTAVKYTRAITSCCPTTEAKMLYPLATNSVVSNWV